MDCNDYTDVDEGNGMFGEGIVVAELYDGDRLSQYQIIGECATTAEGRELRDSYIKWAVNNDMMAPETFAIRRRDAKGFYNLREEIGL